MPLLGGFSLGRWFGFEIRIDWSWFFIFFLVLWTFSEQVFPGRVGGLGRTGYYTMGMVFALLLFLSVLLHELSHSVVARARGIEVEGITLFIFGGVAQTSMEAQKPSDEFLLTIAGPISSVLLAGLFYVLGIGADALAAGAPTIEVLRHLALVNVVLAVFNMIPGFPLDGGRIFRSVVWHLTGDLEKATRWASWGGRAFGYALIGLGLLLMWNGYLMDGLWSAFIGWFLSSAASSAWSQFSARKVLAGVRVEQVMGPGPVTVTPHTSVQRLVDEYFLRRSVGAFPVVLDGRLEGVVSLEEVTAVPPEERGRVLVSEIMRDPGDVPSVRPEETLDEVLALLTSGDDDRVLVVADGDLVGVMTLDDVGGWLERARKLGIGDEDEG